MPKCTSCLKTKKKSQFMPDGRRKNGLSPVCKTCKSEMDSKVRKPKKKNVKNDSAGPATKKCSGCGKRKARDDFSKDRTKKDGLYHLCKVCRSKYRLEKKEAKNVPVKKNRVNTKGNNRKNAKKPLAVVNSEAAHGACSTCGEVLIGYIPGYLQGLPVCKSCVISNLKSMIKEKS